ncbi:Uncharacterized protein HSR121_2992 [Halapricum desulfuricans]|uniref:Uncharacterized protein n=1 Tax=Halapricum desulfuricans TaxID=2841257 RepID=A0A897N3U8_9EURY|nr:Uncharacterized protein HSR121_2992 [Halapricum desulfuricans]
MCGAFNSPALEQRAMSTATKIVLGTIGVSALLAVALIVNTALAA